MKVRYQIFILDSQFSFIFLCELNKKMYKFK